jgi:hypothetical protein
MKMFERQEKLKQRREDKKKSAVSTLSILLTTV